MTRAAMTTARLRRRFPRDEGERVARCGPWRRSDRAGGAEQVAQTLVTTSGDDGIRTHDPLLAKQVL